VDRRGPAAVRRGLLRFLAWHGGVGLIATNGLGMKVSDLAGSPFGSYLLPGLALAVIVGGLMGAAAVADWRATDWAPLLSFAAGGALVVFEIVEALSIGGIRSGLQPALFTLALIPALAGLRDSQVSTAAARRRLHRQPRACPSGRAGREAAPREEHAA
jgi:hypothetical protein